MDKKLAVVALGGNAILRGDQKGTMAEQNQNIRETLENLIYLIRDGYNLIITHGNGPQVGKKCMDCLRCLWTCVLLILRGRSDI